MKLRPFITHTIIFASGLSVASCYFLFAVLPSTKSQIIGDPQYISLAKGEKPESYAQILQQDYLGSLYLRAPIYFFKRQEGLNILANLAERGYTPAAKNLYNYYLKETFNLSNSQEHVDSYMKAYHWAMAEAEQGSPHDLLTLVVAGQLESHKEITTELALLESWAEKAATDAPAFSLHKYYDKQGNKEKAQEWLNTAKKIRDEHRPAPACTTITPWRGY